MSIEPIVDGGVCAPGGFAAGAATCGLKHSGEPDLAMVFSERACRGAGLFTRNRLPAAPVVLDRETLAGNADRLHGVVANAGIANACTGPAGMQAAREMQRTTAESWGCRPDQVLVLSTGVIGVQLPVDRMQDGIRQCAAGLSSGGGPAAAAAIMTTDTRRKQVALRLGLPDGTVSIGGMAKGAGMIHPDMATMLAVLTTDADIEAAALQRLLAQAVERSFHRITVDGDTSTNDSVLLLANGASGVPVEGEQARRSFGEALERACLALAQAIVRDGEGAQKLLELTVSGAPDEAAAVQVAKTIAGSPLVKTALAGGDPNWGRVLAAAGRAGIPLKPDRLALWIGGPQREQLQLAAGGVSAEWSASEAASILGGREVSMRLDLGDGAAEATVWTCDLTREYVSINAEYQP